MFFDTSDFDGNEYGGAKFAGSASIIKKVVLLLVHQLVNEL